MKNTEAEPTMRVHFTADHRFRPPENPRVSVLYKAGKTYDRVRKVAAEEAVALGKGRIDGGKGKAKVEVAPEPVAAMAEKDGADE